MAFPETISIPIPIAIPIQAEARKLSCEPVDLPQALESQRAHHRNQGKVRAMDPQNHTWKPLQADKLSEIGRLFGELFPADRCGTLAADITAYWMDMLKEVWRGKAPALREKDERHVPRDPLARIRQKTVVITYADSVWARGEASLDTLDAFLKSHFPALGGMHMLPACQVAATRFNDGYFSQVVRHTTHPAFGTNAKFAAMMADYYSMADFVLNHVDIENPDFQAYLAGDDERGACFYVFSEQAYRRRLANGDFDRIFRPRPFPLFSIYRRRPADDMFAEMELSEKIDHLTALTGGRLPAPIVGLLVIFNLLKNDQMLLDEQYRMVLTFRDYLQALSAIDPDSIFVVSETQETNQVPYILPDRIQTPPDLLEAIGFEPEKAGELATLFSRHANAIFGEEIRALTTFSHVQVDLNTSTLQGLKMLADDFAWYLGLDLNMLRLDAANFAFKRWKTTCFGLPEVKDLMQILYLSMDCVAPRMVANLEVNDQLSAVLEQMADKQAPPPMMYDFHLAGMLPAAFITGNAGLFRRIFDKIATYTLDPHSIRFSLAESHDGKSVRGSLDLLTLAERQAVADTVVKNGGRIKYKGVPRFEYPVDEFKEVCRESDLTYESARQMLFTNTAPEETSLTLADHIRDTSALATALGISPARFETEGALKFFSTKILEGREPYELCVATRDCLPPLDDRQLVAARFLAFYTLAFSLMGRNVKSIYFNDLMGLPNDYARLRQTGELRDLKRTKSELAVLEQKLADPATVAYTIARGLNNLIALVDADPALGPRGREAAVPNLADLPAGVAVVHCAADTHTQVVVNITGGKKAVRIDPGEFGFPLQRNLYDNIKHRSIPAESGGLLELVLAPFECYWLTARKVAVPPALLLP